MSERVAVTIYAYINRDDPNEMVQWGDLWDRAGLLASSFNDIDAELVLTEGPLP